MRKPDFNKSTKLATELLYKQTNISSRILNIEDLTYDKNIIFDSLQNYCLYTNTPIEKIISSKNQLLTDGCTLYDSLKDLYIVLYNDNIQCFEHLNWTLAHEVGHIEHKHTEDGEVEEIEAHFFASQLFMPEYSLYMMAKIYGKITAKDLVEIFGVSYSAAKKSLITMDKRGSISPSLMDKHIWELQKERIDFYFFCKRMCIDYRKALPDLELSCSIMSMK